jgi:hypothetical protein
MTTCFNKTKQNDGQKLWRDRTIMTWFGQNFMTIMKGSEPFSLLNYDEVIMTWWEPFYEIRAFSDYDDRNGAKLDTAIMTRKKLERSYSFLKLIFTSCLMSAIFLMSVIFLVSAIGDFTWNSANFLDRHFVGTGFNWPANLFTGTGFFFYELHDTMQGSERIRHSILCKI